MQPPEQPWPWQRYPAVQLLAVLIGCGPVYGLAIWSGFTVDQSAIPIPSALGSALNAVLMVAAFGGLVLLAMWLLNGEPPHALSLKPSGLGRDIFQGVYLCGVLLALQIAYMGIYSVLSGQPVAPPAFNAELGKALAGDRWLLAVWLTLVAWLQAGFLEEYMRAFMLSRLWRVWPSPAGQWLALLGSSLLFGMGHMYQGALGVYGTALIGFILGAHYLRNGRVLPLIIGHALYNSCVMAALAVGSNLPSTAG
jgi:uncharacterized protein